MTDKGESRHSDSVHERGVTGMLPPVTLEPSCPQAKALARITQTTARSLAHIPVWNGEIKKAK